jgi:hypothetical protein
MTTPRVTEIPPRMAAVEADPFAQAPAPEHQAHARRLDLVRGLMRGTRNAAPARRTERA